VAIVVVVAVLALPWRRRPTPRSRSTASRWAKKHVTMWNNGVRHQMVDVAHIITGITAGAVTGFGIDPATNPPAVWTQRDWSDANHIKEYSQDVTVNAPAVAGRVTFTSPAPANLHDRSRGRWLYYDANWTTFATANRDCKIVAGRHYRGCLYSVYHTGNGNFVCTHTSRSLPSTDPLATGDALLGVNHWVVGLKRYALDRNWDLVHEIPTAGAANGVAGVDNIGFVTRIMYNLNPVEVRTVRVLFNNMGLFIVGHHHRVDTPVPM
jgi:hypothetical protein